MFLLVVSLNPHNDPSGVEDDKVGPDEKGLDLSPPQLNTSNNNGIIFCRRRLKVIRKFRHELILVLCLGFIGRDILISPVWVFQRLCDNIEHLIRFVIGFAILDILFIGGTSNFQFLRLLFTTGISPERICKNLQMMTMMIQ